MNWDHIIPMLLSVLVPLWGFWGIHRILVGNVTGNKWEAAQRNPQMRKFFVGMSKEAYIALQRKIAWVTLLGLSIFLCAALYTMVTAPEKFSLHKMMAPKHSQPQTETN